MKQIFRNSSQVIEVTETEIPAVDPESILIEVRASLISTGTETVGYGAGSLVSRSLRNPSKMKVLADSMQNIGIKKTIHKVQDKLMEQSPMGYSGAGVVVSVGENIRGIAIGDRVAYMGAPHAEYVTVGQNMAAIIPDGVSFNEAAFSAVACIAMHGVRLGNPTLGETALVLGFGLVGLQAAQFAQASGMRVIGLETNANRREIARNIGLTTIFDPTSEENLVTTILSMTDGHGVDKVYLCAGVKNSEVTNTAIQCCRDQGEVIMIGDMGLNLDRGPLFSKEVNFRVSRSYGPGRYEFDYQDKGLDYPVGFVRWTAQRNLACFLQLVKDDKIDVKSIITSVVPMEKANEAYAELNTPSGSNDLAIILQYSDKKEPEPKAPVVKKAKKATKSKKLRIGVIGCGAFAESNLLPHFKSLGAELYGVANRTGSAFNRLKKRYSPTVLTTQWEELANDENVDAFLVSTQHHLHYSMAKTIVKNGKPVHVEKPLALTLDESEHLAELVRNHNSLLTIGFNRRFAPDIVEIRKLLQNSCAEPRHISYRVNAPVLPLNHWLLDPERGGGRLVGEGCHFIDLLCYLSDSEVIDISGAMLGGEGIADAQDNFSLTLRFANGDVGTVIYSGQGHPVMPKERIELFCGGRVVVMDDFTGLQAYGLNLPATTKEHKADKGFKAHLEMFLNAVRGQTPLMTTVDDGVRVARIIENFRTDLEYNEPS